MKNVHEMLRNYEKSMQKKPKQNKSCVIISKKNGFYKNEGNGKRNNEFINLL